MIETLKDKVNGDAGLVPKGGYLTGRSIQRTLMS